MTSPLIQSDQILDALGHQTRRDILKLLQLRPQPVGEIAAQLPISRPAVSKHLRILGQAELVEYDARGASNIFRLRPTGFKAAQAYLESFWDEALLNFKMLAEEAGGEEV